MGEDALKENEAGTQPRPLKAVVVGAGIGGLMTGIVLRQQGHDVTILERSRFANEVGAAIHLTPNAYGLLRRVGLEPANWGAVPLLWYTEYTPSGELIRSTDFRPAMKLWSHPWGLSHRVDLHENLKRLATTTEGKGNPVELRTAAHVVDLDCENATVILASGEKLSGDVVIAADGVNSGLRSKISRTNLAPKPSSKNLFRFMIPKDAALADPQTAKIVEKECEFIMWLAKDRRLVMYPCRDNTLLNFAGIHPDDLTDAFLSDTGKAESGSWNESTSIELLLKAFESYAPEVLKLISKTDPSSLKLWKLFDMDRLPTWCNGNSALLGDAAHPFLPHQGQGGAQALEDATSLGAVLPLGTRPEEIPERLRLYEQCRSDRAWKVQEHTRIAGRDQVENTQEPTMNVKLDMMKFVNYNFGHDEWDYSGEMLRKWKLAKNSNAYCRMPTVWGPPPGFLQDSDGQQQKTALSSFVTATIRFRTSRTFLQNLLPNKKFSFLSPGTVAYASLSVTTLDKVQWLNGSSYDCLGLVIHGIQYHADDGSVIKGDYMPVLFENLADSVVSGREDFGLPKVFCDLKVSTSDNNSYTAEASWQGAKFCDFCLDQLKPIDSSEPNTVGEAENQGILVYKYIPATGDPGKADVEYPVLIPAAKTAVESVQVADVSRFSIGEIDREKLPTLYHIVSRIAEMPVYEILQGRIVTGKRDVELSGIRRLD